MMSWRCVVAVGLALAPCGVAAAGDVAGLGAGDGPGALAPWAVAAAAMGHHGPGTSGGGSATISGETLRAGAFDLDLRADYTRFREFSREGAEARAARSGEFDALTQSVVGTVSLAYGITDDFQASATIGYYAGDDFINAEVDEETGEVESGESDPRGLTDLWLNLKYRVLKGKPGNIALVAGLKLPTGRENVRLDNGEFLEPSSQPGTGAVDFQAGAAYSRFLTSQLTVDASVLYTFRTRHDDFKVGDRLDTGVALAYRLTEDINQFPQWSVFAELTGVYVEKDRPEEGPNPNTGGFTLFLTPGARIRFNPHVALTLAPSVPVYQDLYGDQDRTEFKGAATLSISF